MKNWRTTIVAFGAAAVVVAKSVIVEGHSLSDWKIWVIPALIQLFGLLAKDAAVTGVGADATTAPKPLS